MKGTRLRRTLLRTPYLQLFSDDEIVRQVENDRLTLSDIIGYEVVGFAYPGGGTNYNDHVADVIKKQHRSKVLPYNCFEPQL